MATNKYVRLFAAGGIALLIVGAAAACGGGGSGDTKPTAGLEVKTPGSDGGAKTADSGGDKGAESIKVTMKDNVFDPKTLTIPVGKSVEITVKNEGEAIHNLHILSEAKEGKDFSSSATVPPKTENKFTVKFTKAGTYNFQCDYHVPDMVGKITVK